jgi:hypothetical protein
VSKGKLYSTIVLNLLLIRMRELGADSAAPPTAEYFPQPLCARDHGASAAHLLL